MVAWVGRKETQRGKREFFDKLNCILKEKW
jgi:hypothetical protein